MAIASRVKEVMESKIQGTTVYLAPEARQNKPYSLPADMYSIGLIMWEIWNKLRIPQEYQQDETVYDRVPQDLQRDPGFIEVKEGIQNTQWQQLAIKCWDLLPEKRLTANEAYKELEKSEMNN